jgi:hypothetical protein
MLILMGAVAARVQRLVLPTLLHHHFLLTPSHHRPRVTAAAGTRAGGGANAQIGLSIPHPEYKWPRFDRPHKGLVGDHRAPFGLHHQLNSPALASRHVVRLVELHQLQAWHQHRGVEMLEVNLHDDIRDRTAAAVVPASHVHTQDNVGADVDARAAARGQAVIAYQKGKEMVKRCRVCKDDGNGDDDGDGAMCLRW